MRGCVYSAGPGDVRRTTSIDTRITGASSTSSATAAVKSSTALNVGYQAESRINTPIGTTGAATAAAARRSRLSDWPLAVTAWPLAGAAWPLAPAAARLRGKRGLDTSPHPFLMRLKTAELLRNTLASQTSGRLFPIRVGRPGTARRGLGNYSSSQGAAGE